MDEGLKVIITGGAGCIGFATIKALLQHHPDTTIHILDLSTPSLTQPPFSVFQDKENQLHFHKTDITSPAQLSQVFESVRPHAVIHTASIIPSAARKRQLNNEGLWKVNVQGTKNVLEVAEQTPGVRALVYTSSCDAVKPDSWMAFENATEAETEYLRDDVGREKWDNEYARSKAAAEKQVLSPDLRIQTCAIRTHGVVGTLDQNLFPLVATSPRKISLGSGKNLYDFTSADNVGLAHVLALNNLLEISGDGDDGKQSANRRAFFITDGNPKPFRELQEMIWRVVDDGDNSPAESYGKYTVIPVWLFKTLIRIAGLFGKTAISPSEIGDAVSPRYFCIDEARRVLGYKPEENVGLEKSMRDAFEWWKITSAVSKKGKEK